MSFSSPLMFLDWRRSNSIVLTFFSTPMVIFNSKNIVGTSYVSCTQRAQRGGGWRRVSGTINLSPSWAWNPHQLGRNSSLSRRAKVACPSFNLWLTRRCQKHAQKHDFNTWESFKQKLQTLSFSLSVDGDGDSIFVRVFFIAKSGCCHMYVVNVVICR